MTTPESDFERGNSAQQVAQYAAQYEVAERGRLEAGTWADVTPLPRRARFDHEAGAPIEAVPPIGSVS